MCTEFEMLEVKVPIVFLGMVGFSPPREGRYLQPKTFGTQTDAAVYTTLTCAINWLSSIPDRCCLRVVSENIYGSLWRTWKGTCCPQPRRSSAGFVHQLSMILQKHCAVQDHVAPGMGARDWLTVWMVAEMLAMEVLFEVAASRESLQAIGGR